MAWGDESLSRFLLERNLTDETGIAAYRAEMAFVEIPLGLGNVVYEYESVGRAGRTTAGSEKRESAEKKRERSAASKPRARNRYWANHGAAASGLDRGAGLDTALVDGVAGIAEVVGWWRMSPSVASARGSARESWWYAR